MSIDIMKVLVERTKDIDKIIENYIPRKYTEKDMEILAGKPRYKYNLEASTLSISDPIWDLLDRGGKRWRPAMMLMIIDALGKKSSDYKDFSIIPEVIHNATIVHDDIEDNSETRREKPCLHKIYGDDIAINVGDGMFFLPIKVFMTHKEKLTKDQTIKLYEIYTQEMINVCLGQGMDISWHKGTANADKITEAEYLQMCAYKTGCLARMSAKLGACVAGADEKTIEKLGILAESIGVAFQIQDDILNLIGEEFKKGKGGFGEDIHEGKRTLMVVHTLNKADEKDRKRLLEILNMHTWNSLLINEAIELMKKYNAFDYAKTRAKQILEDSWKEAATLLKESNAKEELKAFAHFLIDRKI
ncbi:MAG: polyprenyl synthetase family protein [Candidatus Aenigmarchaeota archaeon]|nr:polyprenyl synthetase family protein [Candidatus Aenigmarchaeota archaeon]